MSGTIFDLEDWPSNWSELTERSLVELLRIASTGHAWPFGWMARGSPALEASPDLGHPTVVPR